MTTTAAGGRAVAVSDRVAAAHQMLVALVEGL